MANYNTTSDCGCTQNPSKRQMSASPQMANTPNCQTANMPRQQMANMPKQRMANMPRQQMANMPRQQMSNMPRQQMAGHSSTTRPCPGKPDPMAGMPIAMAYVPWQFFQDVYEPEKALQTGTIFPELDKPFLGKGGCMK